MAKRISEMSDAELKEYYKQKEEEKERRRRILHEIKVEEEQREEETRRRLEAEHYETHREEIETKKRIEAERAKEYERKCAKETIIGVIGIIIVCVAFMTCIGMDIGEAIIGYTIMFGWIIITCALVLIKRE